MAEETAKAQEAGGDAVNQEVILKKNKQYLANNKRL